jgi:ABC-type amino acid transport substrate-binding protein
MVEYNSSEEGARAVRDGKLSAFICDYPVAQYFTQVGVADAAAGSKVV